MKKAIIIFSVLFIFFISIIFLARSLNNDSTLLPSNMINKTIPNFNLTTLENPEESISQSAIQGPALLNVWATWCPTCAAEHAMLNKLRREGIKIYGVNYKDDAQAAVDWLAEHGNPYEFSLYDQEGQFGLDLGVYGAPETFFISKEGLIIHRHVGDINQAVWDRELKAIYQSLDASQ